ncbi:hypothetical protein SporoP37_15745 [Sporosarcina sp. P37]|uniref:hypothetical protein n=1 Tax=unclassified Sporosarcina TaxID=2647733 RepID=UPI000A179E96|nr:MULTISPECIES: hypothetical protein [unclassified Sporosarcina]ARK25979.1 hypothetical protein SporoP37_15745 [Sporosarcina sp. P37]PID19349.1 hypothetical protein CSV62_02265 [Sporosarcina sp. P35]
MQHIINQLILTAGAWNESGQRDKVLENQFDQYLFELQLLTDTDHDGAMHILLRSLNSDEAAA